jgi:hypothetical protein
MDRTKENHTYPIIEIAFLILDFGYKNGVDFLKK